MYMSARREGRCEATSNAIHEANAGREGFGLSFSSLASPRRLSLFLPPFRSSLLSFSRSLCLSLASSSFSLFLMRYALVYRMTGVWGVMSWENDVSTPSSLTCRFMSFSFASMCFHHCQLSRTAPITFVHVRVHTPSLSLSLRHSISPKAFFRSCFQYRWRPLVFLHLLQLFHSLSDNVSLSLPLATGFV